MLHRQCRRVLPHALLLAMLAAWPAGRASAQPAEAPAAGTPVAPLVVPYLWGGMLEASGGANAGAGVARFHRSVGFLLDHGFQAVRFTVTTAALPELGLAGGLCRAEQGIACPLEAALADPVFDRPELGLLMVTLHEARAREALGEGLSAAAEDDLAAEFSLALDVLWRRFRGRRLRVVVSNWEGDNMVHCGSVARYARQADFAARCETGAGDGVDLRLARFMAWMALRDRAVAAARRRHPAFDLEHAPEFNIARLGPDNCNTRCDVRRTVFEAIAREGGRKLCSYSAYNSTNRGLLAEDLPRLLRGCERLILGELGFDAARQGQEGARRGFALAAEAVARFPGRVPAVVVWNAFNRAGSEARDRHGLFDADGGAALLPALPPALAPRPGGPLPRPAGRRVREGRVREGRGPGRENPPPPPAPAPPGRRRRIAAPCGSPAPRRPSPPRGCPPG